MLWKFYYYFLALIFFSITFQVSAFALSSPNVPLDSPIYLYIEKLAGFGLISSDFKGIRPYSRSEVARLIEEAEDKMSSGSYPPLATDVVNRLVELLPRETLLRNEPGKAPLFDVTPVSNAKMRYVYLNGVPRNYERVVNDPGGDWIFPLPQERTVKPFPSLAHQHGTEGTPLLENNEGIIYGRGNNLEGRWSSELYAGSLLSGVVEPLLLWSEDQDGMSLRLNKGYLKVGGGGLELEIGRDANWLGPGYRGALILTDNARNLTSIKVSSPEPVDLRWFWDFKYDLIVSQLDKTVTNRAERQPIFYAVKLSMKPSSNIEFGMSIGRQQGGPGTDNSMRATLNGLGGGTNDDNSHTLAGMELRLRFPWLANVEVYGEFAGSDRSDFWPQADSYVTGFLIPRLTPSGKDDLRFEYFLGHPILYDNSTFPEGYLYHNLPLGHSQGGATEDFFVRYSHWFSARSNLALEWIYTTRGNIGRVPVDASGNFDPAGSMQALEHKVAMRAWWRAPLYGDWDANLMYGWEKVENMNLVSGADRTNNLLRVDVSYRY